MFDQRDQSFLLIYNNACFEQVENLLIVRDDVINTRDQGQFWGWVSSDF